MKNIWLSRTVIRCVQQQCVFCQQQDLGELVSDCTELKVIIQASDLRLLCGATMSWSAQIVQDPAKIVLGIEASCLRQLKTEQRGERLVRKQHAPQQRWG